MLFTPKGHAAVLLFALTQSLVSASLDDVEDKTVVSAENIIDYLTIPWLEGVDSILHPSESSHAKEARAFIRGVESGEIWALQMLDALVKIQKEIPKRNDQDIGTYDQGIKINAQYNSINIPNNNNWKMDSHGISSVINDGNNDLLSSACDQSLNEEPKIEQIVNDTTMSKPSTSEMDFEANDSSSAGVESKNFSIVKISAIIFFSILSGFMIACTICDIVRRINNCSYEKSSTTLNTLSKFSLYTNALTILSTEVTSHTMPAIHGIRCLCFCSVIIGHHYIKTLLELGQMVTLLHLLEIKNSWLTVYIMMIPWVIDTFFIMSGFFTSYLFFKSMHSGIKFNLPMIYLHRYLRITPSVVALILYSIIVSNGTGTGPPLKIILNQSVDHCRKDWWIYLFYVQNLVKDGYMCLPFCWYVAVDMQLFWMSPLILYPLHRWPKYGLKLFSLFSIASVVAPVINLATNGYFNALLRLDLDISTYMENYEYNYISTYNRVFPYLIGILLGYDVAKKKRCLTQINVAINWIIAGTLILISVWFTIHVYNSNFAYDLVMETGFIVLARPAWSVAIAWIIYACTQGYGGLATRLLSMPIFFPLSRLAFCIYLVHTAIQTIIITPFRTYAEAFGYEMFYVICFELAVSFAVALTFSLLFESPAIVLAKILTSSRRQPEQMTLAQNSEKKK